MEDRRVGLILRALRLRKGLRQVDVAQQAGVSQSTESRAERGHFALLSQAAVRSLFAAVDARAELDIRWRGGEVDRLLDERHGHVVAEAARFASAFGWTVLGEVTFAVYGERGSIDLLAFREQERVAAIFEMKASVASWEETQRRFDGKTRLLPKIMFERFGWRPTTIGRFIVFQEDVTSRRRLARLGPLLQQSFPASSREIRAWLRKPDGPMAGIWFLSVSHGRTTRRVRRPAEPTSTSATAAAERGSEPTLRQRRPQRGQGSDS
jgi:transcriptional regulator with XRE-family HTH domain